MGVHEKSDSSVHEVEYCGVRRGFFKSNLDLCLSERIHFEIPDGRRPYFPNLFFNHEAYKKGADTTISFEDFGAKHLNEW